MKKVALVFSAYAACIVGQTCTHEEWMTQERVYQLENKQMLDSWKKKSEDQQAGIDSRHKELLDSIFPR